MHCQFSHDKSDKLKLLLRDAEVMDKDLEDLLDRSDDSCSIWKKHRRPKPRPVVGFPMAKTFNKKLRVDLKEWSHSPKIWLLHLVVHAHIIVDHVSYTPKKKKKLSKVSFRYGYLFLIPLKSFVSTMEEISTMMNSGLYVKMLI